MDAYFAASSDDSAAVPEAHSDDRLRLLPTGTVPPPLASRFLCSPVGRWWVPALAGEMKAPVRASGLARSPGVVQHRMDDEGADPLIIPSEWGVF